MAQPAYEHAAGHAECYVCPCARLLPNPDVEVGPDAELLRLTYNGVRASVWLRHGDDTLAGAHKLEVAAR